MLRADCYETAVKCGLTINLAVAICEPHKRSRCNIGHTIRNKNKENAMLDVSNRDFYARI